jgi:hypothetical protein
VPRLKIENIASLVHAVRGEKVLIDADLAISCFDSPHRKRERSWFQGHKL